MAEINKMIYTRILLLSGLQGPPKRDFFRAVLAQPLTSVSGPPAKGSSACKAGGACLGEGSAGLSTTSTRTPLQNLQP